MFFCRTATAIVSDSTKRDVPIENIESFGRNSSEEGFIRTYAEDSGRPGFPKNVMASYNYMSVKCR